MIGVNGGLIGQAKSTSTAPSVPGVWTPREQANFRQQYVWPGTDPYANLSVLILNAEGPNNSTTITDSSSSSKVITPVGDAKISTAQGRFGGSSIAFDGNGDYLSLPNSADFDLDSDYTIEFFFYKNDNVDAVFYSRGGGSADWSLASGHLILISWVSSNLYVQYHSSTNTWVTLTRAVPATQQWHHVAVSRNLSTTSAYLNGVQFGTSTTEPTLPTKRDITRIGSIASGGYFLNGFIGPFRITKNVGRYPSNFTVPHTPFSGVL